MVIYQQDVDARFYVAMLERIIEQYHIHVFGSFITLQVVDTSYSFCIYCHIDVGEFLVHLEWLVANLRHFRIFVGKYIAVALAFVATRKHGNFSLVV